MKHFVAFAVIIAALAAVMASTTPGLTRETSSIHGSVVDSKSNRPIQSVTVAAWAVHARAPVGSTLTGKDGTFRISGLAGGEYRLTISANGYQVEDVTGLSVRKDEHLIIASPIALRRATLTSQSGITRTQCSALLNPTETADVYVVCNGR